MRLSKYIPVVFLFVSFLNVGCTRQASSTTSVRLNFSNRQNLGKVGTQGEVVSPTPTPVTPLPPVMRVVVQVTGPNIATPIYFLWNAKKVLDANKNWTFTTPPEVIDISVTKGEDRLIQAFVVEMDTVSDGPGRFLYGDDKRKIVNDSEPISIEMKNVGGLASFKNGSISGQYTNSSGVAPTGRVSMYFRPPNTDKPRMLVDQNHEMFAGWFNVFSIEGIPLSYIAPDGSEMFGGPVALDSASLLAEGTASQRVMRVFAPESYRGNCSDSSCRRAVPASRGVYGYFGAVAEGKKVCFRDSVVAIPNLYQEATSNDQISWNPSATVPGAADAYVETVNSVRGGYATQTLDSANLCTVTDKNRFADYLSFNEQMMAERDNALGYRGPFQLQQNSNGGTEVLSRTITGSTLSLSFKLLPGVEAALGRKDGVVGIDLFARIEVTSFSDDFKGDNDGVRCGELERLKFIRVGTKLTPPVANADPAGKTYTAVGENLDAPTLSAISNGRVTMIACPWGGTSTDKKYFGSAAILYPNSGGGNNPGSGLHLELQGQGDNLNSTLGMSSTDQFVDSCKKYSVTTYDSNQSVWKLDQSVTLGVLVKDSSTNTTLKIYTDPSCSTLAPTRLTYSTWIGSANFYVRAPSNSGSYSVNLGLLYDQGSVPFQSTLQIVSQNPVNSLKLVVKPKADFSAQLMDLYFPMVVEQCYPISYEAKDASGNPAVVSSTVAEIPLLQAYSTAGTNPNPPGQFYADNGCTMALGSNKFIFPTGASQTVLYYKPWRTENWVSFGAGPTPVFSTVEASSGLMVEDITSMKFAPMLKKDSLSAGMPAEFTRFDNGKWWHPGGCSKVYLEPVTANYGRINRSRIADADVQLMAGSAPTGLFYSDASCSGTALTNMTYKHLATGTDSNNIYFKNSSSSATLWVQSSPTMNYFLPAEMFLQTTGNKLCADSNSGKSCRVGALVSFRDASGAPYIAPEVMNINTYENNQMMSKPLVLMSSDDGADTCTELSTTPKIISVQKDKSQNFFFLCTQSSDKTTTLVLDLMNGAKKASVDLSSEPGVPGALAKMVLLAPTPVLNGNSFVKGGVCEPVRAFTTDGAGRLLRPTSAELGMGNLTGGTGYLFGDQACANMATSDVITIGGFSGRGFFVKLPFNQSVTFEDAATVPGTSSVIKGSVKINAN